MSRTSTDALRSLKKYLTLFLPNDFDVRLSTDQDAWSRPSAMIDFSTPQTIMGGPKVFDITRSFSIYVWPTKDPDNTDNSRLAALEVEDNFVEAIQLGGQIGGRPRRIPLYDYDEVGMSSALPIGREDGYMRVMDFTTDPRRDPDDDAAWTIVVTLRVAWRRLGEGKEELVGNIVTAVKENPFVN